MLGQPFKTLVHLLDNVGTLKIYIIIFNVVISIIPRCLKKFFMFLLKHRIMLFPYRWMIFLYQFAIQGSIFYVDIYIF